MPRPTRAMPEQWNENDEEVFQELTSYVDPYLVSVLRTLEKFTEFRSVNRNEAWIESHECALRFFSQLKRQGYAASTAYGMFEKVLEWRMLKSSVDQVKENVSKYRVRAIASKNARQQTPRIDKGRKGPTFAEIGATVEPRLNDTERDLQYRLLWFLALVTGNRIENIRNIQTMRHDQEGIWVTWEEGRANVTAYRARFITFSSGRVSRQRT